MVGLVILLFLYVRHVVELYDELAGVLAYGVMNQLYYSTAFAVLWLGPMGAVAMAAPAGAGLGAKLAVSSKQFGKVFLRWRSLVLGEEIYVAHGFQPVRVLLDLLLNLRHSEYSCIAAVLRAARATQFRILSTTC